MLRQYTNQLKNYNFVQTITEGTYLDAKDEGKWKVGQVQQIRKVGHKWSIRVMFDGYPSKYNQDYDLPSYSKLAPFRKNTLPYTGVSGQEPRRQEPSKTLQHYIKVMNKALNDLDSLKSNDINQFFRGQLFIFIDYSLTVSIRQERKYSYEDYVRLFSTYLELFDKILDKVIDFLEENEKDFIFDQNYIYVHPKMALLYSITEFLFNCNSLVSKNQQRVTFHTYFGKQQPQNEIYLSFLQKVKTLKLYQKCQKLISYKSNNGTKSLPWSIKKQLIIFTKSLNPQEKIKLPRQTKQIIEFLEYLPYFTKKGVITFEVEQRYRNELIFFLILSGNFQGKLIGLGEIKKIILSTYYISSKKEDAVMQMIKQKNLIGFFLDNNNFNSELFKRSLVIFQFAYRRKFFTKDQFTAVLRLHKDKHELELQNFYASVAQFGSFLSEKDAFEFFQMIIKELPFQENFIQLVKNFTISTIEKNANFARSLMRKDQDGLGLTYFWNLINKQNNFSKQITNKVIESFAKLLNFSYFSSQIQRFVVSSIKAIKEMKNPESFLKVIHQSLKLCKGSKMNRAIDNAEKEINVIDAAMTMLRQQQNDLSKDGFQNLFEFLQEVNYISRKGLTPNDIFFLWKMDKAKCRSHLLRFLRKYKIRPNQEKSHQRIISKSLDIQQIQFIIKNIFQSSLMMQNYKQIDDEHFQTIDELILCYLHNKKIIDYNYKHTIRYKKNQFFSDENKKFPGMDFYLKCIENNSEKQADVIQKAIKRLIDIFLRPLQADFNGRYATQFKIRNWVRISKEFDNLKNNRLKCFSIQLKEIYGRMKSLNILQPDLIEIKVRQATSGRTESFTLPRFTSLWKFRLLIDQKFELKQTNFQIQLLEQRTKTSLERQQDLSVAFIVTSKEKNGISVLVHPSKEKHPHFYAIDKFKEQLCDMIGEGLFRNLSSTKQQKSAQSLQILYSLPFVKSLQKSIQSLQFKSWSQIIDIQSMKKIEYQLKIINKVKQLKWIQTFINKNGVKHLTDVILSNIGKNNNNYKTLHLVIAFFIEACKFIRKGGLTFDQKFLKEILYFDKEVNNMKDQIKEHYINYLISCFTIIKETSGKLQLPTIFQKEKIHKILELVLFTTKKSNVSSDLIEICRANNSYSSLSKILRVFIDYDYLINKETCCRPFFEVIRLLMQRGEKQKINDLLEQLLIKIRWSNLKQKSQNQVNQLLYGYLSCVYENIKSNLNGESVLKQSKQQFYLYLLNQCLFHSQNISNRKFKSKQLRELGFKVLQILEIQTKKDSQINKLLIPMMTNGAWRKQTQWSIEPVQIVNKKFTGLKNLAATCYINSLLQQLFYIKNFSSQLMSIDADKIDDRENIVKEIQNIFGFLKYSVNPSFTTSSLCQNFILDGQPIDPRIQTDVDEFFHALMDKLQRNLQKINKKQIINEVFRGQFSNMIIGQECPHTSERIQHFLSIRLQIKNKKTIHQALDQFIKGEILQGQNSYFCQKCDKKVKALKRVCLKDLPEVLIVTLKRFEFDYETMQKFKLNTYCSFPENINFLPYTKEGLQQESDAKKDDYEYKLKGVVIHYGISQAGHYTSYVRTDDKSWNYFDDERIYDFSLNELQKQCFGGIEQNPFGDDEQKKKNAYLLIYEKVKPSNERLKVIPQQKIIESKVYKLVEEDNTKTKLVNLLFESNIENFVYNLSEANWKTFMTYFHTVFLRNGKKREKYIQFYQKCIEILSKKSNAEWYLKQINESFIMQFVLWAELQVRNIVVSLICHSLKLVVDMGFLQQCVGSLNGKSIIPFVKIFSIAYQSQPKYAKYLNEINFGDIVLNLIKGKQIKQNNPIKKVQIRKQISEFGNPISFFQRKLHDPICFFQAIQNMKVGLSLDQFQHFATVIKQKRLLKSLALLLIRKNRQLQSFKALIQQWLSKQLLSFDPKTGQEHYYWFLLQVIEQFCKIDDKDQQKRIIICVKLYIECMKDALAGYRCQLMLINEFFKICLTNSVFRNIASSFLNDKQNKKFISALKDWLKDLPNVINNIKNSKWGWWKKVKNQYPNLTAKSIENDIKPNIKQALGLLNAIIEKHQISNVSQFLQVGDIGCIELRYGPELVEITRKMGFLVQIKDGQNQHRWISEDEVIKKFI